MRRLPIYLLLDTSASMSGEPINAVQNGLNLLISTLRQDPYALETAFLSVITFDTEARQIVPLTEITDFQTPDIQARGVTALGDALRTAAQCINTEVQKSSAQVKGDWKPLVFLMTDGLPTDDWKPALQEYRVARPGLTVCCAAGPGVDTAVLSEISDTVVTLDTADSSTISAFFKWVSASITVSSRKIDLTKDDAIGGDLPLPPAGISLIKT
ncbi:MAG: VWA domain-containing protein [Rhodobacteraceae bacterium]|nr:VWA domain-containing protein [Paracoccaceae bacterium]